MSTRRRPKKRKKPVPPRPPRVVFTPPPLPTRYERPRAADLAVLVMLVAGVLLLIVPFAFERLVPRVNGNGMAGFLLADLFVVLTSLVVFIHVEVKARRRWAAAQPQVRAAPAPVVVPAASPAPEPVRVRVRPADFGATLAMLERRGRDVEAWHAELEGLGGATYRGIALRDDTLVAITEADDIDGDVRDAAAMVLRGRGG